jgi:inorganic pyrophosphatase
MRNAEFGMRDAGGHAAQSYAELAAERFRWEAWEGVIAARGVEIDRPRAKPHPRFPEVVYPLDYGYVPGTLSSDGEAIDVFVGTAPRLAGCDLVGAILTRDHRQGKREWKLLWRCTPPEIYCAHGFLSFDRRLIDGTLALRFPMPTLWQRLGA